MGFGKFFIKISGGDTYSGPKSILCPIIASLGASHKDKKILDNITTTSEMNYCFMFLLNVKQ